MSHPASARLLLDEMFSPAIAAALRDLGQDVIAVAERGELRAISDDDVFAWATSQRRWLLPSIIVTRPSVRSTGFASARPILAFPAASANITTTVTAVQMIPSTECRGRYPAASTTVD